MVAKPRDASSPVSKGGAGGLFKGMELYEGCTSFSFGLSRPLYGGPYGFLLSSPMAYKESIPYRGQLGFFQVEEDKMAIHGQVS